MSERRSYLAAAFNAKPFGMPVPPNWFALAAFGLLGALINPGFWLIGAGVEGLYLWALSRSERFRKAIDATSPVQQKWDSRYQSLIDPLDGDARDVQGALERQAAEIVQLLSRVGANESQIGDVRQMVWLHLKLLAARASLVEVLQVANRERRNLEEQEQRLAERIKHADDELRRSLEQQVMVIQSRRAAHADANRRCNIVDAELERLRQQIALVREQALLATDEHSVAQSLDALSASLNEANRWLKDQRELFAGLDDMTDEAPPAELLQPKSSTSRRQRVSE
jgi:chromosome segregation ATPase